MWKLNNILSLSEGLVIPDVVSPREFKYGIWAKENRKQTKKIPVLFLNVCVIRCALVNPYWDFTFIHRSVSPNHYAQHRVTQGDGPRFVSAVTAEGRRTSNFLAHRSSR